MSRRIAMAACALAALLALPGCGEREEELGAGSGESVRISLGADAGEGAVYAAEAAGHFKAAGLKVELHQVPDGVAAIKEVQSGKSDLAVASEPELLGERAKGAKVQSVAALVRSPLTSLITGNQDAGATIRDLVTKPIGTSGADHEREFAETIFEEAGGRARVQAVPDLAAALEKRDVAALIAPFGSSGLPAGLRAKPVDQQGVPTFSDYLLVAPSDASADEEDTIRSFIGALTRGTRKDALDQVDQPGVADALQGAGTDAIREFMLPARGKPYGWHDAAQWKAFAGWMRERGLQQKGTKGAFTNDLLPGQGL